jgi:hypothetical protein
MGIHTRRMTPNQIRHLHKMVALELEYQQIQEDLEAFLNVPVGVRLDWRFFETKAWLEGRMYRIGRKLSRDKKTA